MRYPARVKPISDLKANAAEIVSDPIEHREPMVITQNGEPTTAFRHTVSSEDTLETLETLTLLKLLALGARDLETGRTRPARAGDARLRSRASDR